jgi:hypothetical protein
MLQQRAIVKALVAAIGAPILALSLANTAIAQQSGGSINGRAANAATVQAVNPQIGISRQINVAADGAYAISQLPPGTYTVTVSFADGRKETREVIVAAGEGVTANFGAIDTVVVTGAAIRSIDVLSTESAQTLTKEQLDRIPVAARDVTAVTLLAPGATQGDARIGQVGSRSGNVPSLGGASPAENAYYINGFNVTNIVNGIAFNEVPFEAIGETQVKTGGYGAEFGRSLGGVVSITTKRGTNEWKGGANVIWKPDFLRSSSFYADKTATTGDWVFVNRPGKSEDFTVNLWGGGPIIEDKLFAFGLIQGTQTKRDVFGVDRQEFTKSDTPQYLIKLDWNVNQNNLLELTAFNDKAKDTTENFRSPFPYGSVQGEKLGTDVFEKGGQNTIVKWTSWLTDNFNVSALAGRGEYSRASSISSASCPIVQDRRGATPLFPGCWTEGIVGDPNAKDTRDAFRLDGEWKLGKHTLKAGLDNEDYTVVDGTRYSGGTFYRISTLSPGATAPNGYVNNTGAPQDIVRVRSFENGGTFKIKNSAFYIEDGIQVTKNIYTTIGLRNEQFKNLNGEGRPFVEVKNTWAPRLGASWDVQGDGSLKVYGNAGRYFIPVYGNTNVRLSGKESDFSDFFVYTGTLGPVPQQIPGLGAQLGGRLVTQPGVVKDPRTVVDPNLKALFQDEFILGFQKALQNRWTVGAKVTHRNLKNTMDDICEGDLAGQWAAANGFSAGQADAIRRSINNCFLANPGRDLTANVDLDGTGQLTRVVIPASVLKLPEPKRTYNAIEFMFERAWDKKWSLQGSYLLSFSKGNTEGYVKSDIGQDDAGLSQDFDHPGLMEGAEGYLPNDRRHTFKLFGSYAVTPEWTVGASAIIQSGRPRNCFGIYAGTLDTASINYANASFYCNGVLTPRGSLGRLPWTREYNAQVAYAPQWQKGLLFKMDVLNVLNTRGYKGIEESFDDDPLYGRPILGSTQSPRSVRLTAQYEF